MIFTKTASQANNVVSRISGCQGPDDNLLPCSTPLSHALAAMLTSRATGERVSYSDLASVG